MPGAWVEVRPAAEVLGTLDATWTEDTGIIRAVRDTVILDGSICDRYLGCARGMPVLWREAWLKPLAPAVRAASPGERPGAVWRPPPAPRGRAADERS
jgi:hypothetical protein